MISGKSKSLESTILMKISQGFFPSLGWLAFMFNLDEVVLIKRL